MPEKNILKQKQFKIPEDNSEINYQSCEKSFFVTEKMAQEYQKLLKENQVFLEKIFANNEIGPENLPKEFYQKLSDLKEREEHYWWEDTLLASEKSLIEKKDDLEVLLSKTGIKFNEKQLQFLSSRVSAHFLRLIAPEEYSLKLSGKPEIYQKIQNNICSKFTKDFLNYLTKSDEIDEEELKIFQQIPGGEGKGTIIFWTFSPYIHLELSKFEKNSDKSIEKIFLWLKNACKKAEKNKKNNFALMENNFDYTRFPIKKFRILPDKIYLGFDERLPSHLFVRLLARKISQEIRKNL